jgi:hypothetical protein
MHYIAGTRIRVSAIRPGGPIRPGMTSSQIRASSPKRSLYTKHRELLKPDTDYTLTRIYKDQDKVVYVFNSSDMSRTELQFDTITDAERFISELRNENLPNYDDVYKNMTD